MDSGFAHANAPSEAAVADGGFVGVDVARDQVRGDGPGRPTAVSALHDLSFEGLKVVGRVSVLTLGKRG